MNPLTVVVLGLLCSTTSGGLLGSGTGGLLGLGSPTQLSPLANFLNTLIKPTNPLLGQNGVLSTQLFQQLLVNLTSVPSNQLNNLTAVGVAQLRKVLIDQTVNGATDELQSQIPLLNQLLKNYGTIDSLLTPVMAYFVRKIALPVVDCTDPVGLVANYTILNGQLPNCYSDCTFVHGFESGKCGPSKKFNDGQATCWCSEEQMDQTAFQNLRVDVLTKNQLVGTALSGLCDINTFSQVWHAACNTDCIYGHEYDKGICVTDVTQTDKGLCHCYNNAA